MIFENMQWTEMQFWNIQGLKCNFIRKNMLLKEFSKHVEDLCVILKHAGAKIQFYKENNAIKWSVHANERPKCKNKKR